MKKILILWCCLGLLGFVVSADAALTERGTWNGSYGMSSDGWGGTNQNGVISAEVPVGATVAAAYLYSTTYSFGAPNSLGTVTLAGTGVTFLDSWDLQWNVPNQNYFRTGIADVTSIVASTINGGAGGVYNFGVTESSSYTDGEALIVVYEDASLPESTVVIMDGPTALAGDTFNVNYAELLDPTDPGFFADMRLGISFSCCSQISNIDVNGNLLSNNAGNNDDGELVANGSLITMGGFDDDLLNTNSYAGDDERYDLTPFVNTGDTTIQVNTNNPSNDDNIFIATFWTSGIAAVNEPPSENPVPEPGTYLLFGIGILGLAGYKKKMG